MLGAVDPGVVANICVQVRDQLCTPCQLDPECSATSKDICYAFPTGGSYCARDCSIISCPMGFSCQSVTVNGNSLQQCLPASGACDCNAMYQGATKTCNITTPFGSCYRARALHGRRYRLDRLPAPPSPTDQPDDSFTDSNCDGIDGDVTQGVFVGTDDPNTSSDPNACGTLAMPCKTIALGLGRAATLNLPYIYVQVGSYSEEVVLTAGRTIVGGYDPDVACAARAKPPATPSPSPARSTPPTDSI